MQQVQTEQQRLLEGGSEGMNNSLCGGKMGTVNKDAVLDIIQKLPDVHMIGLICRDEAIDEITALPSAQPEIIRCKDCKHWIRQMAYNGAPLSFGFCESENMWQSLYGETTEVAHIDTDDDHYCGYAERRTDDRE